MGDKKGIFSTWLKQFLILVFTQSFQAIFMAFSLAVMANIISGVSAVKFKDGTMDALGDASRTKYFICSIVAYVSITALVKMEKVVKQIFGVEDSAFLGDMNKNMKELMHGARHMMSLANRVKETKDGIKSARENVAKQKKIYDRKKAAGLFDKTGGGMPGSSSLEGGKGGIKALGDKIADSIDSAAGSGSGSGSGKKHKDIDWGDDSKFDSKGNLLSEEDQQKRKIFEANSQYDLAKRKAVLQTLSAIGSIGVANGASDTFDEAMASADVMDKALMYGGKKIAESQNKRYQGREAVKEISKSIAQEQEAVQKVVDDIRKSAMDDIKNGIDSSVDRIATERNATAEIRRTSQATREMFADLSKDYDKTVGERMSAAFEEKAKAWKEAGRTTISTVTGGPRSTKSERDAIKKVKAQAEKNTNN